MSPAQSAVRAVLPTAQPAVFQPQGPRTSRGQVKIVRHQIEVSPWLACSLSIRSKTRPAVTSSRSPVGSSASSSRGLLTSARASATRCCSPPESSPGRWSADPQDPLLSANWPPPPAPLALSATARKQRHGHVFQRRKLRQQIMELPHVADLPIAKGRGLPRGQLGHVS